MIDTEIEARALVVLEALDAAILWDITERDGSTEEAPLYKDVCYVGWPQELAAGIRGGSLSGCFDTINEAYRWIADNEERLLAEVEAQP